MDSLSPTPTGPPVSLGTIYQQLRRALEPLSETAPLDARLALSHVLGRSASWVLAHPEYALSAAELQQLAEITGRLLEGRPLPVVLGSWEFYGLTFELNEHVLIPRPETELMVETALAWRGSHPAERRVVDVGTGSGCIAVSLAVQDPGAALLAVDLSGKALQVARSNARRHGVEARISFWQGDLLEALEETSVDLICANLPYIPTSTLERLPVYSREPPLALDGGREGLDLIRRLLAQAPGCLAPGGALLLEIEASQGDRARALSMEAFPEARLRLHQDLAGHDRLLAVETVRSAQPA